VYVAEAAAVTVWVAAPPSDQLWKAYEVPDRVCGLGADTETAESSTAVFVNGVVPGVPFTVMVSPAGTASNVSVTVRGSSRRMIVVASPPESVAVSFSSR
jgi:hypothetical protein